MPRHPAAPANRLRGTLESTLESTMYFPTKSTLPFGPSVAFVSLGSSVAFVPKINIAINVLCLAAHGGVRKEGWPPLQPSASHTQP